MKKGILFSIGILFSFILVISFVSAYEQNYTSTLGGASSIQITSLRYEPYPVQPNEQFKIWVKVQNEGVVEAQNARCRIVPQKPFSLYQGDSEKSYGVLGTYEAAVIDFSLKVDESAVDGTADLLVECSDNLNSAWIQNKIPIKIQTRYPTLNIVNVKTVPDFLEPGKNAQLLITLENSAFSSMKDIKVTPDFSSVSIAPYQELGKKTISRMAAGEIKDLIFNIIALPDAEGGIYKVPLAVNFTDDLGTPYTLNGVIAVEINSNPDIEVYVDSTDLTTSTKTGNIVFKVVNKGLTDLKFMNVRLLENKKLKVISGSTLYIGNVDSDDFETVEFRVHAKSSKMVFPLELEYKDINNKEHIDNVNVTYNLASNSELGKGSGIFSWVLFIIIILAAVFVFRNRKKLPEKLLEKIKSFWK